MANDMDPSAYAESLRRSLISDLFEGEDLDGDADDGADGDYTIGEFTVGTGALSLQGVEQDLEEFADHEVIRGILEHGRVLKEYTRDIDDKLRQAELESIQDYIQESDSMVALHDQIKACDSILGGMENLLGTFQSELGRVSEEIRTLQIQSNSMSTKLKNRRAAECKLGSFVEHITISEDLVHNVLEHEINEDYLEYLLLLDKKLKFVSEDETAASSQAKRDLDPALQKLRIKALAKVREFLLQKVYQLKRPKTNVQIIQTSVLLKFRHFCRFLRQHGPDMYEEVRGDHMFQLGERASVLNASSQAAIIPHMAEYEGKKFPYEVVFRNVHKLLMDTATSEFFFALDFFGDESVWRELLAPIIAVVEQDLAAAVQEQWDVLSLLLMVHIAHDLRKAMAKKKVPCMDDYLDRIQLLLWPRCKVVFDAHLHSLRSGTEKALFVNESTHPHYVTRRYAAMTSSMLQLMAEYDSEDDSVFKAQTFYDMTERLWREVHALLLRLSNMFKERRTGIIFLIVNYSHISSVLKQAASEGGDSSSSVPSSSSSGSGMGGGGSGAAAQRGGQGRDSTSGSLQGAGAGGQVGAAGIGRTGLNALKECDEQLHSCMGLYVEDQLGGSFREMVEFVKKAEQQHKRSAVADGSPIPGFGPAQASPILHDFGARWMSALESMTKEVLGQFEGTSCGRDVLQASMTQLLKYYTRMLELLKRQGPEGHLLAKEAVNIPSIMYEVKRITR
ncbi:MAG: hypothetical protein WDW38_001227 [Sanguina aurantia]